MADWRTRLQSASFRGVRFEVVGHKAAAAGRRVQTHVYPGRDTPYTEDLGRKPTSYEIEAYLVGSDYADRRDALVVACGRPGPGTLSHPYLGSHEVICTSCTVAERSSEGRIARVSLEFVAAGRNAEPAARVDTAAAVESAAAAVQDAAAAQFLAADQPLGLPAWASRAESIVRPIGLIFRDVGHAFFGRRGRALRKEGSGVAGRPDTIVQAVVGLARQVQEPAALVEIARQVAAIPRWRGTNTSFGRRAAAWQQHLYDFTRTAASAALGVRVTEATYADRDAVTAARNSYTRLTETVVDAADAPTYSALRDLGGVVSEALAEIRDGLPPVTIAAPSTVLPSLVIAYDLYGDIDRAAEIAERNGLPRPGFASTRPLRVLVS